MHNFYPSRLKLFGLKLILVFSNHILLFASIYNFLNSNCPNTSNSRTIKSLQNKLSQYLQSKRNKKLTKEIVLMPSIQKIPKFTFF